MRRPIVTCVRSLRVALANLSFVHVRDCGRGAIVAGFWF